MSDLAYLNVNFFKSEKHFSKMIIYLITKFL